MVMRLGRFVGLLLFPLVLMNSLNNTEPAVFLYSRFSISEGSIFPDYLEVVAAVVVLRGDGKHLRVHQYSVVIFSIFCSFRNVVL